MAFLQDSGTELQVIREVESISIVVEISTSDLEGVVARATLTEFGAVGKVSAIRLVDVGE